MWEKSINVDRGEHMRLIWNLFLLIYILCELVII
jgi:hypothetical protein